jgi:hypothetical protein
MLALSVQSNIQAADLVSSLTEQLGISSEQATGGAGAVFDYAKKNLSADDFATISKGIPDMSSLLASAPKVDTNSALGQVSNLLGASDNSLGGLASLTSSFDSLNMDKSMVSKFLPAVYEYVDSVSGEQALGLLKGLF